MNSKPLCESLEGASTTRWGPELNAALIFDCPRPGTFTTRSRGKDTKYPVFCVGSTWITMSVSERCPPSVDASPKAAFSSVFWAVLTFTRGISSILRSMNTFTPTTPPTTSGKATASASAKRPSRTRENDGVIEQVIVSATAEVPGSYRKNGAADHRATTLRVVNRPGAAALLAAL